MAGYGVLRASREPVHHAHGHGKRVKERPGHCVLLTSYVPVSRRLDVRNPRQFERPLVQHRLVYRLEAVVRVVFAVALRDVRASVPRIWPMRGAHPALECVLLADEILLRRIRHGHVARVDGEARLIRLRAQIVVRRARVPYQQITWIGTHLDPFAALLLEPLHAIVGETKPLWSPRGDARLILHGCVELV